MMCVDASNGSMTFDTYNSCSNTMACFISLFVANSQIGRSQLDNFMNGSPIKVATSNPNIVLSLSKDYVKRILKNINLLNPLFSYSYNKMAQKYSHYVANKQFQILSDKLLSQDESIHLPRIFFCSITFVTSNHEKEMKILRDHKFTIIKHTNMNYQLVQAYIGTPIAIVIPIKIKATDNNTLMTGEQQNEQLAFKLLREQKLKADTTVAFCANCHLYLNPTTNITLSGFNLRSWQMQEQNVYANRNGFDRDNMKLFLNSLSLFASSPQFNPQEYEAMFGVYLSTNGIDRNCCQYAKEIIQTAGNGCSSNSNSDSDSDSNSRDCGVSSELLSSSVCTTYTANCTLPNKGTEGYSKDTPPRSSVTTLSEDYTYWPGVGHEELTDDWIIGCGDISFANNISDQIDANKLYYKV